MAQRNASSIQTASAVARGIRRQDTLISVAICIMSPYSQCGSGRAGYGSPAVHDPISNMTPDLYVKPEMWAPLIPQLVTETGFIG